MVLRKIYCTSLIAVMIALSVIGGLSCNIYALTDGGQPTIVDIDHNDLTDAFLAYCRARDITIEGSILDAATSFSSNAFNIICKNLGIDAYQLQAEIKKAVDPESNRLKYFVFTQLGITGFNRVCAQFLTDYNLRTGDEDVNERVYNGYYFGGQLFYVFNSGYGGASDKTNFNPDMTDGLLAIGSDLTPKGSYIYNNYPVSGNNGDTGYTQSITCPDGQVYVVNAYKQKPNSYIFLWSNQNNPRTIIYEKNYNNGDVVGDGAMCFMHDNRTGNDFLGSYMLYTASAPSYAGKISFTRMMQLGVGNKEPAQVDIVSPVIKPDLPEDPCNIAPDGNVTPTDQDPTEPPPDPIGGNPPAWDLGQDVEPDGDGGFKLPFSLPDLDINWKIEGLSNKFPFCIPKDIVAVVGVLNVPASPPRFTGTIDLFIYDWTLDINFEQFETIGTIVRNGIFILFCIGLLVATRAIIRG